MPVYHLPMPVKGDIRPYQYVCIIEKKNNTGIYFSLIWFQDGINWLMFLKRYNLHCVLADDMGLGKVRLYWFSYFVYFIFLLDTSNNLCSCFGYCWTKKRGLKKTIEIDFIIYLLLIESWYSTITCCFTSNINSTLDKWNE